MDELTDRPAVFTPSVDNSSVSLALQTFVRSAHLAVSDEYAASTEWLAALASVEGSSTGCEHPREVLVIAWMWETVLPSLQPNADRLGFGESWSRMTTERTWRQAEKTSRDASDIDRSISNIANLASYIFPATPVDAIQGVVNIGARAAILSGGWAGLQPARLLRDLVAAR